MRIYVVTSRCGCLMDPPSCYKSKADAEKAVRKMVLVVLRDMVDEAIANDGIEDEVGVLLVITYLTAKRQVVLALC